ncbi:MAG: MerR family transcriptional regulator [Atopobiaceae bacterium]|nr:MerR family transcriptional regulator [Atopobiaceae bacterium]
MRTIHEVSELAGISIRTLRYYDKIGLLKPAAHTDSGYRLYDDANLDRLQQILLFRELEFSLADIQDIVGSPDFDRRRALEQQVKLLQLKRKRIDELLKLAEDLMEEEGCNMSFDAFDKSKMREYTHQAKASWGTTSEWQEYENRSKGRSEQDEMDLGMQLMELFVPLGRLAREGADPACAEAQEQVAKIQTFISEHYYPCTDEIFAQLGLSYGAGGEFTRNINAVAGDDAAEFASRAILGLTKGQDT